MVAEVARISARQLLTTADHASLALLRVHQLHAGKTAHRALSTVTHVRLVTHVTHAMLAQRPVATSDATGAQHLLLAAATFSAMTVILVIHVTRTSLAQPVLSAAQPLLGARVTVAHHVVGKIAQRALSIVTHAHRAIRVTVAHLVALKTVRLARSIVTHVRLASSKTDHNVIRTSLVQPVLSEAQPLLGTRVTHDQRAMVTHAQQELSTEQNLADHASSMTALASSTATIATTAPTVVRTVLTA
jgi:hypothetical protein